MQTFIVSEGKVRPRELGYYPKNVRDMNDASAEMRQVRHTGGQATRATQNGCITTLFVRLVGTTTDKPLSALDDG
jgi:hypothetical protein